jgi:hypothetical protein
MIAEACIATNLPPEAFGVESSPELGDVMLEVLLDRGRDAAREERLDRLRRRTA